VFSQAPASTKNNLCMHILYRYAANYALNRPVALNVRLPRDPPRDVDELADLCAKHVAMDLYLWLANRFPRYFVERELCLQQRTHAVAMIEQALQSDTLKQKHCHVESYKRIRESSKMFFGNEDSLPAFCDPRIREVFLKVLSEVPEEYRFVSVPRSDSRMESTKLAA